MLSRWYFSITDDDKLVNSFAKIYPILFKIKVEYWGNHISFSNLDIAIMEETFVYKLFDKKRHISSVFIMRKSHFDSKIAQNVFYSVMTGEFVRITR